MNHLYPHYYYKNKLISAFINAINTNVAFDSLKTWLPKHMIKGCSESNAPYLFLHNLQQIYSQIEQVFSLLKNFFKKSVTTSNELYATLEIYMAITATEMLHTIQLCLNPFFGLHKSSASVNRCNFFSIHEFNDIHT